MERETELAHVSDPDPLGEKQGRGLDEERADHCPVPTAADGYPLYAVCGNVTHDDSTVDPYNVFPPGLREVDLLLQVKEGIRKMAGRVSASMT